MARYRILGVCLFLMACVGRMERAPALPFAPAAETAKDPGSLRVMSYNVKGLPWPLASEPEITLDAIGAELAAMRRTGEHPQIVVLQEAFIEDAKRIGRKAGYRHVVFGPGAAPAAAQAAGPIGQAYARRANWLKGETFAPVMDSGLALFSDYPVERIERLAFPQGACAGFDCLAAKGVLIAWIRLPGQADPIAVATTHLNSLHSSGVPLPRANAAFAWQFARVREFAQARIGEDQPAIFAGDFNLGANAQRVAAARRIGTPLAGAREAVTVALARGAVPGRHRAEARAVRDKGTDQLFYRSGHALRLEPVTLDIPFPETGTDRPLSDHPGLMVRYALSAAS